MIIRKEYKFYAAHRNEELHDKCSNLHGHRYGVVCHFRVRRTGSYSTLFGDFDARIEPFLKEHFDHGMLINVHDPLLQTLKTHMQEHGENFKLREFDGPTSVENLAYQLFGEITAMGFDLEQVDVRETDTSVIMYTREDYQADQAHLASSQSEEAVAKA